MRLSILLILSSIITISTTTSCTKTETETETEDSVLKSFDSLCASANIVFIGETLSITAYAQGTHLRYTWDATSGDIIGSGNQIEYIPHPCTPGDQTITCKIEADNTNDSKSVTIRVE